MWKAIKRLFKSPYAWSLSVFIVTQGLFLYCVNNKYLPAKWSNLLPENAQTAFFICSVHVLLFVNTIAFLIDMTPKVSFVQNLPDLNEDKAIDTKIRNSIKATYSGFIWFAIVSVFLSGGIATFVFLTWSNVIPNEQFWQIAIQGSEYLSGILFVFFVFSDLCCLEIGLRALQLDPKPTCLDKTRTEQTVRTLKRFILAIDIPGALGIWLIIACSHWLYPRFIQPTYWEGFTAGAIGLHIAFSQTALAFLSVMDDYNDASSS